MKDNLDLEFLIKTYYEKPFLTNSDIKTILGIRSDSTVREKKKKIREKMSENETQTLFHGTVDTKSAYEVWGFDIGELEKRYQKLKKLGLYSSSENKA